MSKRKSIPRKLDPEEIEASSEYLSGPDWLMVRRGGKPSKLPKKTRGGPEESYYRIRGYKGRK